MARCGRISLNQVSPTSGTPVASAGTNCKLPTGLPACVVVKGGRKNHERFITREMLHHNCTNATITCTERKDNIYLGPGTGSLPRNESIANGGEVFQLLERAICARRRSERKAPGRRRRVVPVTDRRHGHRPRPRRRRAATPSPGPLRVAARAAVLGACSVVVVVQVIFPLLVQGIQRRPTRRLAGFYLPLIVSNWTSSELSTEPPSFMEVMERSRAGARKGAEAVRSAHPARDRQGGEQRRAQGVSQKKGPTAVSFTSAHCPAQALCALRRGGAAMRGRRSPLTDGGSRAGGADAPSAGPRLKSAL
ncbi:Protein of unknown function [Gryllus bimaculatus]|nr:Protein of unknown function [Gryllus bimaculatus]